MCVENETSHRNWCRIFHPALGIYRQSLYFYPVMGNTIIIHSVDHATAALAAAEQFDRPVTLLSAPAAAAYLGATVFRDMIAAAAELHPRARHQAVLDCGDDPGLAMGALRHGIKGVRITNGKVIRDKLADIAGQRGAFVYEDGGETIDLLGMTDPLAACRAWLAHAADATETGDG